MAPPFSIREVGGIRIDARQWPLVVWEQPERPTSDAVTVQALACLKELWEGTPRGEKSFMVTDLSRARGSTANSRKIAAEFMAQNGELQKRASLGGALIVTSSVMRGVITAVFWIRPPSQPTKIASTRDEAILYGLDALEAAGPLPSHLQALRKETRAGAG